MLANLDVAGSCVLGWPWHIRPANNLSTSTLSTHSLASISPPLQASAVGQRQLLQLDNTTITIQGSFVPSAGFTGADVTNFLDANLSRDLCDLTTAPSVAPPVRVCTGTEFESIPYSLPQALQGLSLSVKPAVNDGTVSGSPGST